MVQTGVCRRHDHLLSHGRRASKAPSPAGMAHTDCPCRRLWRRRQGCRIHFRRSGERSGALKRRQRPAKDTRVLTVTPSASSFSRPPRIGQIDHEAGGDDLRAYLPEQLDSALGRAAGGDQIDFTNPASASAARIVAHGNVLPRRPLALTIALEKVRKTHGNAPRRPIHAPELHNPRQSQPQSGHSPSISRNS